MRRNRMAMSVLGAFAGLALVAGCASAPLPGDPAEMPSSSAAAPGSTAASQAAPSQGAPSKAATGTGSGVTCEYQPGGEPARPVDLPPSADVPNTGTVTFTLNMTEGPVVLTLDRAAAPCTVNSFAALVQQGYYDDTSCHRLVDQGIFVLQCGDPTGTGRGGPGYRYADELTGTETYPAGTVAMANAGPNTNGSQFFLVWADTKLNPDYTVFGTFDAASLEIVTGIASKGISLENSPAPISPAKIESVSVG